MDKYSFLNAVSPSQIEEMYEKYLNYPDSLEPQWRIFFQGFDFGNESYGSENDIQPEQSYSNSKNVDNNDSPKILKELKVVKLIQEYRSRGHLFTKNNPVRERRKYSPNLTDISRFELSDSDLNKTFEAAKLVGLSKPSKLKEIIEVLEKIFCNSIGVEFMYIRKPEEKEWIRQWLEVNANQPNFSNDKKKEILNKLNHSVEFEQFLQKKYVGKKRFSLEGCESLVPALNEIIERSSNEGVKEVVLGMPHRGRLNVLTNVFGKSYKDIFTEFEEKEYGEDSFEGDVKYHLGWTAERNFKDKKIKLNLAPNPSHLETVNAIVEGISRGKIDSHHSEKYSEVLPILLHGDASISGQGIVYEVLQMSQLDGYKTGGTIHIIVNNQIGFTTNYTDSRSSTYCTDIAKLTLSPVLHINADDVEAVIHAVQFAVEYRMKFNKDVFIDLLGYRKYGHNEGDEPRFTQPILYKIISKHPNVKKIYSDKLLKDSVIDNEYLKKLDVDFKKKLEKELDEGKSAKNTIIEPIMKDEWKGLSLTNKDILKISNTSITQDKLNEYINILTTVPQDKKLVKKITKLLAERKKCVEEDRVDWGTAELLSYASLLDENHDVRLTGQDVERGTFSHRHAVMKVEDSEERVVPLSNFNKGDFYVYNSLLSEYGAMGFEYGYAMSNPNTLTIWEAQFGDFSNGAQIIIDQYLSSAEDKWKMQNGLILFLPHGYEGQGAEHSSGRMERYLQLCAGNNMYVANCTTPANFFHLLRLQMKRNFRKPLIIFTPKSLLRHPKCISTKNDFIKGNFLPIIEDNLIDKNKAKTIVFCTGKIYYDILEQREELKRDDVAVIRLEQISPLDKNAISKVIKSYKTMDIVWAQEEPENMGAWSYILRNLNDIKFRVCSIKESGTTASGNSKQWAKKHKEAINKIFNK